MFCTKCGAGFFNGLNITSNPVQEQKIFDPTHKVDTNDGANLRLRSSPSTSGDDNIITSLKVGSFAQVLFLFP